jgi:hypothetical protein
VLAFAGGAVEAHGLPEVCSGHSSSGVFVAAQSGEQPDFGGLDDDVLRRLEREAAEAIGEADASGLGLEPHIQYLRTVQRQCRGELASREGRG